MARRFVIEDVMRPFRRNELLAPIRSHCPDHSETCSTRKLDPGNAHAAACAMNQHDFSAARLRSLKKRAVGGTVRNVHRRTLCERRICWQREHRMLLAQCLLRVGACQAARKVNSIASLEPRDSSSN